MVDIGQAVKPIKKIVLIIIALSCLVIIHNINLSSSITDIGGITLTKTGKSAIAVLVFALILWMSEAVPFHITGFFAIFFLVVLRVDTFGNIVRSGFGNQIVMFMLGVLILSAFVSKSGLGKRITLIILSHTGNCTKSIILGFLFTGTILSMWLSNMAVAAILMPLGRTILQDENIKPLKSNFGKALMIACAWGPVIGGIGTPAGAGPNPLTIEFLREMAGINISFLQWMSIGIPAALLLIIPSWLILLFFFPPEIKYLSKSKDDLIMELKALLSVGREEIITIIIFLTTIFLWITSPVIEKLFGFRIPISMSVMFTSSLFFIPGISKIHWKNIEKEISWEGIILVLSGISIGMMLHKTHAANWLAEISLGGIGSLSFFLKILVIILIVSFLKVLFSSNSVTATIVVPIIIAFAQSMELSILGMVLPAALTSSLAFILVTSSPTNVIPYSAGYFTIGDMAKAGVTMTIASSVIVAFVIYFLGNTINIL